MLGKFRKSLGKHVPANGFMLLFVHSVMSNSLQPHGSQHARLSCPSVSPELAQTYVHWVSDAIQTSHTPLSPSPPAFNLSQHQAGSLLMSQLFPLGDQSIGASASASVLPINSQDWFPLGFTGLISRWLGWCHLHIWDYWYFSRKSWFQLVLDSSLCSPEIFMMYSA